MSYQVGSFCYATKGAALSAVASSQTGAVVNQGASSYVISASASSSGVTYDYYGADTGVLSFSVSVPVAVPPCGLLGVSDGFVLAWGVALVWFVAWGIGYLARHVNHGALGVVNDA